MGTPGGARLTRARIVDAAMTLFAERGYDGVSTRDLGQRADCNIATLNYHFGGKQRLYEAVVAEVYERLRGELAGALEQALGAADEDLRARLEAVVGRFYAALRKERRGVRLLLREVLDRGRLAPGLERTHVLGNLEAADEVVARLLRTTRPRARQALVAASFLATRYVVHDDQALARSLGVERPDRAHAIAIGTLCDAIAAWLGPPS